MHLHTETGGLKNAALVSKVTKGESGLSYRSVLKKNEQKLQRKNMSPNNRTKVLFRSSVGRELCLKYQSARQH